MPNVPEKHTQKEQKMSLPEQGLKEMVVIPPSTSEPTSQGPSSSATFLPGKSSQKVKKKPGPKPGSKNKTKHGSFPPGSGDPANPVNPVLQVKPHEYRKDPSEISEIHAALALVQENREKDYKRLEELAPVYEAQYGRALHIGAAPVHPLSVEVGNGVNPSIPVRHAHKMVKVLSKLPHLFGLECESKQDELDDLAEAISDYSKYYPELEGKVWDGLNLAMAAGVCVAPYVREVKAKKRGEWHIARAQLEAGGYLQKEAPVNVTKKGKDNVKGS